MKVERKRLEASMHELGKIGETPRGGLTRLALTDEDKRGRTSGAGHDAQYMAAIGPTGMIFVPSRGGRSHCEEEFTPMDDIEHGAQTLLLAALDLAGRA